MAIAKRASAPSGGKKQGGAMSKTTQQWPTVTTGQAPPQRDTFSVTSTAAPAAGGGGGFGGGSPAAATAAAARPSLDDYIKSNFLYTSEQNEGARRLDDFDAETLRQRQDTEADMSVRRGDLQREQDDLGLGNAEDFASRGLGRSGMVFQQQDKINARGADQESAIAQLLTDLLGNRGQGRMQQEQSNRNALNERINQLTSQFNSGQAVI